MAVFQTEGDQTFVSVINRFKPNQPKVNESSSARLTSNNSVHWESPGEVALNSLLVPFKENEEIFRALCGDLADVLLDRSRREMIKISEVYSK